MFPSRAFHLGILAALFYLARIATAADPIATVPAATSLTPAETEFAALVDSFYAELRLFWEKTRNISDANELQEHDPAVKYMPLLLEFEIAHSGDDVGLDALAEVITYAGRGGGPEAPAYIARRDGIQRLKQYEDRELTAAAIPSLANGSYDPQVVDYLREAANSQTAHPTVRAVAAYTLAELLFSHSNARQQMQLRLDAFDDGVQPSREGEADEFREYLASLPPPEAAAAARAEARGLLNDLANAKEPIFRPATRMIDPSGRLVRIDPKPIRKISCISDQAAALLFKHQHLRPGGTAPALERELVDGSPWKLAAERGRVVVIQFSFTGCGPCAEMYPDLRELRAKYPADLSILTILRDKSSEQALTAIKEGKLTWNITCEGVPGDVSTAWAVDSYPEIYVIDRAGKIAAINLRGDFLKHQVEKLIEE